MAELHRKKSTLQDVTLSWYKEEFDKWLTDFKETDDYAALVNDYKERCKIYRELDRKFKETVWNPIKLACGCPEEGPFCWWSPTLPRTDLRMRNQPKGEVQKIG